MTPHKHRKYINLWADGYPIQRELFGDEWVDDHYPTWDEDNKYRVKPNAKEFVTHLTVYNNKLISTFDAPEYYYKPNFTVEYDEHTGEVLSVTKIEE